VQYQSHLKNATHRHQTCHLFSANLTIVFDAKKTTTTTTTKQKKQKKQKKTMLTMRECPEFESDVASILIGASPSQQPTNVDVYLCAFADVLALHSPLYAIFHHLGVSLVFSTMFCAPLCPRRRC
jgi:hypothetical protein